MKTVVAIGLVGMASLALQDPARPPLFRLTADAVRIEVFVRTADHKPVLGLKASDFEIFDNDVPQDIADIVYGEIPVDVTVALDVSFSVKGRTLDQLRRAIGQLMRDLDKEDRLKLILFNSRVNRAVDFTRDVNAVDRAITNAVAGGGTTVLDTLSVALVSASNTERRQLIVCFTDGADTSSITGAGDLLTIAQRTRATLSFVMPPSATPGRGASISPRDQLFNQLVSETGGSRISTASSSDLTSAFRGVLDDFRSAYVIHFRPRGVERTGFHPLKVSVKKAGARVLARRGYFGG